MPSDQTFIEERYLTCLSRPPRAEEARTALAYVRGAADRTEAMQDVLWSLINVREFLFVR